MANNPGVASATRRLSLRLSPVSAFNTDLWDGPLLSSASDMMSSFRKGKERTNVYQYMLTQTDQNTVKSSLPTRRAKC
jgi:hypothetical protein